jgi:thiol-disulfide isomerase/thioredoxin
MFLKSITIFFLSFFLSLYTSTLSGFFAQSKIQSGKWSGSLQLNKETALPFRMEIEKQQKQIVFSIHNGEEKIVLNQLEYENDSVKIDFPNFHSSLKFKVVSKKLLLGYWKNYNKGNEYKIPFKAVFGSTENVTSVNNFDFTGRWKTTFDPKTTDESLAIGVFKSKDSKVTGTFLTETGDYRFLEGNVNGKNFTMSCFDGSHAFHFSGHLDSTATIQGKFYSGKHYSTNWTATNDSSFKLRNPDSLTYTVKKEPFAFKIKNLEGEDFVFPNAAFDNKVTIVQIMGTWCPNCMDETKYFNELYTKYHSNGLEIIAVGYETPNDFEGQVNKIKLLKERHHLDFHFLVGGSANKSLASEQFSMLNQIMSFPTAIIIGRDGEVKRVHTGFNGPGTGKLYDNYVQEMDLFIQELLK